MNTAAHSRWLPARPEVQLADVLVIAQQQHGVVGAARELGSQQDRSFLIADPVGTPALLVKVHRPALSASEIDVQCAVADRLRERGILTPQVFRGADGKRIHSVPDASGGNALVIASTAIDGESLSRLCALDGALAESLGLLAGRVALALADLSHPAQQRELQWEAGCGLSVVTELASHIPEDYRAVCLAAAGASATALDELAEALPRQFVHGDITASNVMRDRAGRNWLVDLGDACESWRVAELAVLVADVFSSTGSLALACRAVRGFTQHTPLNDAELDALWPLVTLRGAVLIASGYAQLAIDPGNDYVREEMLPAWNFLIAATAIPDDEATAQFRLAAGLPHRAALQYVPLVEGLPGGVVDLGIRSAELDRGRWIEPGIEAYLASAALREHSVAVARFGEARLSRVSHSVATVGETRARVIEVWTAQGVPVVAPFAADARAAGDAIELRDCGVVLRVAAVEPAGTFPRRVEAGDLLGYSSGHLIVARRIRDAQADASFIGPEAEWAQDGAADPSVILGVQAVEDPILRRRIEQERRDVAMGGAAERYYDDPPQIERGWDTRLIDTQGRAYLDMVNNVTAIGHSHPHLAELVERQLHLLNTNSRFLYQAYADFTERFLRHAPHPSLDTVIPVNSGSEAVELALRLAQVYTGRRDVIALHEEYHGWTIGADAVTTLESGATDALPKPEWVHLVEPPNAYRGTFRGADAGPAYAKLVADAAAGLVAQGRAPAAFLCEPVIGNSGGIIPPEGYLAAAYEAIRAHGGLAIADEVQVGYGRLGAAFFGCTLQGVVPDIITVAKAAGNAFPFGAVLTRREIVEALQREGTFFSSAGGAPVSAMAAIAVLDVIENEKLQENALRVGAVLKARIEALGQKHPMIGTIHGTGLYLGVELVRDRETLEPAAEETEWLCARLLDYGIIMQATSSRHNVLKIKPPMTLTLADAELFVAALDATLTELGTV